MCIPDESQLSFAIGTSVSSVKSSIGVSSVSSMVAVDIAERKEVVRKRRCVLNLSQRAFFRAGRWPLRPLRKLSLLLAAMSDKEYLFRKSIHNGYIYASLAAPPLYSAFLFANKNPWTVNKTLRATWIGGVAGPDYPTNLFLALISL